MAAVSLNALYRVAIDDGTALVVDGTRHPHISLVDVSGQDVVASMTVADSGVVEVVVVVVGAEA